MEKTYHSHRVEFNGNILCFDCFKTNGEISAPELSIFDYKGKEIKPENSYDIKTLWKPKDD